MTNPEDVNPRNFTVKSIIYNDGDFSIAWGEWEDGEMHLAMRWNGDSNDDAGYPKTFGHPVWFLIPENLTIDITRSLVGNKAANAAAVEKILDDNSSN